MTDETAAIRCDDQTETIITYEDNGAVYEIDDLSILHAEQWGEYAVYENGRQVADFTVPGAFMKEAFRPDVPTDDELVEYAKAAVAAAEGK